MSAADKPRRFSAGRVLFLIITLFPVALYLLAYAAAYIPPTRFWLVALAGLAFPYVVLINVAFLLFWLLSRNKLYALLFFLILLPGIIRLGGYYQPGVFGKQPDNTSGELPDVKVMSYNVRIFDLYNWERDKISDNTRGVFRLIKEQKPDLLCIQEYHGGRYGKVDIADSIMKYSGLKYKSIAFVKISGKERPYGIATFSRWPIIHKGIVSFEENPVNFCMCSDITIGKDTVRLYNAHLESIKFSREDYLFVSEVMNNPEGQEEIRENLLNIVRKLKRAFLFRTHQAEKLSAEIGRSPYPVIVCGDFNDTPSSYTYRKIASGLNDAFRTSGKGFGQTYDGLLPTLRIDYILHDKQHFTTHSFSRIKEPFSDHFPVVANIRLAGTKK